MATSAFRSTTRRSDCAGKAEVSGGGLLVVPSTPTHGDGRRSRRDPSPSPSINRGHYGGKPSASSNSFHRRSTSMSDFSSAKYLSDCSSTTAHRSASTSRNYRSSSGIKGGTRSVCPSDSEVLPFFLSISFVMLVYACVYSVCVCIQCICICMCACMYTCTEVEE